MSGAEDTGDRERFAPVADRYDPHAVEERVFAHWAATDAYERTKAHRADGESYYFVDGPPYTSGAAHMGHAWNKSLKDVYIRYRRMCGYDVYDRPGYDMHGLPIETRVETELGFANKKDIEAFGVDAFIDECKAFAEDSLEGLQADFQSFGVWMDWEDPYRTLDPEYMEGAWWAFSQAHERGLVDRGKRSITQCPRCETAIANNEVEYHQVEDPSIYVKLPLRDREGALVIWTTTPWTLPGNTFVAVAADEPYAAVDATRDGATERLYVAAAVVDHLREVGGYDEVEIVEERDGASMVGWTYAHPLAEQVPDHPQGEGALEVYTADYVEVDRTGLVHSAPGHGEEDFERGRELGLGVFCPVGTDGVFTDAAGAYAGQFVRDANEAIVAALDEKGLLLAADSVVHDYGQCWRCDTDIVQIVTDQWFITVTDIKEELLANIEKSDWYPQEARDNRFRDFVENSPDWNVSRQRYWGIPIPIWTPEDWDGDLAEAIVVGSRAELAERVDQSIDRETVDLHKDTVDDLTITEEGRMYTRVPDVFDVWLDSSVATWGTLGYPGEPGSEEAFAELWPADLIIEAHDQTRGWFWSQLGMGTAAVGEVPYERVMMHGHALMPDGRAMSKSRNVTIEPGEVIDEHGRDPMRLFLLSITARGEDMRIAWDEIAEMQRRLNILWNVFRFPLPYMRMDGFDPDAVDLAGVDLERIDRWILSRLQTVEAEMTEHFDGFEQDKALDALLEFVVEDVSRFYVQVVRERLWTETDDPSKMAAYATLYRVLRETVALVAPFAPFVAEAMYGTLTGDAGHPTVHMCDWPDPDESRRDSDLEADVTVVRAVEEAGSTARQEAERSLRWPVRRVVVVADDASTAAAVDRQRGLVADRLNAREVAVVGPGESWGELQYAGHADMSVLGPAFGADAQAIMQALNDARVDEPTLAALESAVNEAVDGDVELTPEMVEVVTVTPDDVAGAAFDFEGRDAGAVYVDTALTEDIESEGYAREVIRRVQEMRKDLDLALDQSVRLELDVGDDRVADLLDEHEQLVADEVRAGEWGPVEDGHRRTWTIEGVDIEIAIEPLPTPQP